MAKEQKNHQVRCGWAAGGDKNYVDYHDFEWGVPVHDDRLLFEFLILEGAQAGLSWKTVLDKRDGYRRAFYGFDIAKVSEMADDELEQLRNDPTIIRNRLKIESTRSNARAFLAIQQAFGSFDHYLWQFVNGKTIHGHRKEMAEVPASTALSDSISRDLKKRGYRFVGTTIIYAYLQAVGVVNDHTTDCFRYPQLLK